MDKLKGIDVVFEKAVILKDNIITGIHADASEKSEFIAVVKSNSPVQIAESEIVYAFITKEGDGFIDVLNNDGHLIKKSRKEMNNILTHLESPKASILINQELRHMNMITKTKSEILKERLEVFLDNNPQIKAEYEKAKNNEENLTKSNKVRGLLDRLLNSNPELKSAYLESKSNNEFSIADILPKTNQAIERLTEKLSNKNEAKQTESNKVKSRRNRLSR